MKHEKKIQRALRRIKTPDMQTVLPNTARAEVRTALHPRKKWLTAPMALAMAILLTVGAAAAGGVIIHHLNRDVITQNNVTLTEVPEGYVGIYSVADLVKLREDVKTGNASTHYILMSDIIFTDADYAEGGICEGGWEPIPSSGKNQYGRYVASPIVMFNGNGHIIRGLRCHVTYNDIDYRAIHLGLFGTANYNDMTIIHLGMEDCVFTIENPMPETASKRTRYYVGAIAGGANYIGGCYVDGMTVEIRANYQKKVDKKTPEQSDFKFLYINAGGLAGDINYADACYAENVSIRVSAEGEGDAVKLRAGGIAGIATSALNCWTDQSTVITAEGDNYAICETDAIANLPVDYMIPAIMTEEAYTQMMAVIEKSNSIGKDGEPRNGKDTFNYRLVRAYYVRRQAEPRNDAEGEAKAAEGQHSSDTLKVVRNLVQSMKDEHSAMITLTDNELLAQANQLYQFITLTDEWHDVLYVFDPGTSTEEYERLGRVLYEAFGSEEAFRQFCLQYNVRLGNISCYTFAEDTTVTEQRVEGFDFETLWHIVDGRPRLKIFSE